MPKRWTNHLKILFLQTLLSTLEFLPPQFPGDPRGEKLPEFLKKENLTAPDNLSHLAIQMR
ncbi:hypothetical protein M758_UG226800 [Ceratodon purpureus]|nr:hypothetical protein M758_UG226800 [Ceratodon purpureus]